MSQQLKLQVRLPSDVHAWIASRAKECDRSINGQIVSMLRNEMRNMPTKKENSAP